MCAMSVALHFGFYNFCRKYQSLKGATPVMGSRDHGSPADSGGVVGMKPGSTHIVSTTALVIAALWWNAQPDPR